MLDIKKFREELRQKLGSSYKLARENMGLSVDMLDDDDVDSEVKVVESDFGNDIIKIDKEISDYKKKIADLVSKKAEVMSNQADADVAELDSQDKDQELLTASRFNEAENEVNDIGSMEEPNPDYEADRKRTTSDQLEVALKGWRQDMFAASIMNMSPEDLSDFIEGLKVDAMQKLIDNAKISGGGGGSDTSKTGASRPASSSGESGLELADL